MEGETILRMARPEDAAQLLAIYAPYVTETAVSFEYDVPDVAEFSGRIERTLACYPYLSAWVDGEAAGYAYAGPFQSRRAYAWGVETSIYVRRDLRRLGLGRALHGALEEMLKQQNILNMNACIAVPHGESDPYLSWDSVRFHERLGYRMVGRFTQCGYKFGRWYDMVWMERIIGDHGDNPPDVLPIGISGQWTPPVQGRPGRRRGDH